MIFKVLAALALLASTATVGAVETDGQARTATSPGRFDEKSALEFSQKAIGRTLSDFPLTDVQGRRINLSDFRGKPVVLSLIYTSCYHICPTTTRHLSKVVDKAREALGDSFTVVTVGFDTFNDTPEAMRSYGRKQGVDSATWKLLSGDQATVQQLAAEAGFLYYRTTGGFDHLIQATVVDAEGKIYRQVYGMEFDTPLLVEPLKELVYGHRRDNSFLADMTNRVRLFCTVYDPATDRYRFDYSLFIGMAIGATSLAIVLLLLVREWRRSRRASQQPEQP